MKFKNLSIGVATLISVIYSPVSLCADSKNLDVFYYSLSDQYIASFKDQFDAKAKELNINLKSFDANNDAGSQELQIGSTLDNGNAKVINLVVPQFTDDVVNECKKTNARLVFFNRQPDANMLNGYKNAWYVEGDSMQAGELQAQMVADYIKNHPEVDRNHDGKISTVFITGPKTHQATYLRTSTVVNALAAQNSNVEVVSKLNGNFTTLEARGELENFVIHSGFDKVELVICNNDAMALGAISVLNNEGFNTGDKSKNYVPVFGIDAINPAVDAIKEGRMEGTLVNDINEQINVILKLALSGETDNDKLSKELGLKISENGIVYVPYVKIIK